MKAYLHYTARIAAIFCFVFGAVLQSIGAEGLWIPSDGAILKDSLSRCGNVLDFDKIYAPDSGSMSTAMIHFDFGCSGGFMSANGLAITNYHCLFKCISALPQSDSIRSNGFYAPTQDAEKMLSGISVSITRKVTDISASILAVLDTIESYSVRKFVFDTLSQKLEQSISQETGLTARIEPSLHFTRFHLYLSEAFTDVRLVFFPPEYVNFGQEADNWQWPRHSGDFAFVRIYRDGIPLSHCDFVQIADTAAAEHDFAMLLGFPTDTQLYLSSAGLACLKDMLLPIRNTCLKQRCAHYDHALLQKDTYSGAYAGKRFQAMNAIAKFDGASAMLDRYDVIGAKYRAEATIAANNAIAGRLLSELRSKEAEFCTVEQHNALLINSIFGSDLFIATLKLRKLAAPSKDFVTTRSLTLQQLKSFHSSTNPIIEKAIAGDAFAYYIAHTTQKERPVGLRLLDSASAEVFFGTIVAKSILTDAHKTERAIRKFVVGSNNRIERDPLFVLTNSIYSHYIFAIQPTRIALSTAIDSLYNAYYRNASASGFGPAYPDANATLRLSYGLISKTEPADGVVLDWKSQKQGFEEKYLRDSISYAMPKRFRDYVLHQLPDSQAICFTTTCHTSGGMSGSPVLNRSGQMIGLNFDRTQQSTMSDYYYSEQVCRNIAVDVHYIMHLLDHYFGAHSLASEIRAAKAVR